MHHQKPPQPAIRPRFRHKGKPGKERRERHEAVAEQTLVELLKDDAYERKLLSVAKAEKLLGKKGAGAIAELITKPRGKPAIVPDCDKRAAIGATEKDFDDIA